MRRYLFVILFFAVLVAPFALRATLIKSSPAQTNKLDTSAATVVIVTPNPESIRREFADAFAEWHQRRFGQPAQIDYRSYGGTTEIINYLRASRESFKSLGNYGGLDIVWGGGDIPFNTMKGEGFLQSPGISTTELHEMFPRRELGGLPLYDAGDPPVWFGTALSSFGIAFNRDVVKYLGVNEPRTWRDLIDPRWRGWVVMVDPTRSSVAVAVYLIIVERAMQDAADAGRSEEEGWADGMGMVRQLAANARLFTDASGSLPGWVSSGDVGAGMTIDFYAAAQIDAVGSSRMGYAQPIGATQVSPDPIAMLAGAPHRQEALRFIEFVLSEDGQRLWYRQPGTPGGPRLTALYRMPVRAGLYDSDPLLVHERGNPFTAAGTFNAKRSREKTFGILPLLIQASCMDTLDELRAARAAILAAGRTDLDARLGKFPFDQQEALRRAKALDAVKDRPSERLQLLRSWTEQFRSEYAALREAAQK